MEKIFYNENGWVCNRYPYDITVTDGNRYIEVDDDTYAKTLQCEIGMAWRVIDGELSMQVYDEYEFQKNVYQEKMNALKQQLADMDYKTSKYADGEYTQEEWAKIVTERKAIREKIRELERLLSDNS